MKKLLIIGSGYVHTYNYIHLIESYFDEILLVVDKEDTTQKIKTVVLDFSLKKIQNNFITVRAIRKIISQFKPTIIHIHQANSFAYYSLRAASAYNIPTVLTCWGSDIFLLPQRNFIMKNMVTYNLKHATALTGCAYHMAEIISKLSGRNVKDVLIANFGIEIENLSSEKENIIYSNRLHKPLYRIDKLISAFKKFHDTEEGKKWKLIIAATGEKTEHLKKLVAILKLDHAIEFAGWVDKKQNDLYYSRSKIFVSIPESDCTSISLLEAMSYGCLPVVYDLPANREVLTHLKNGFIIQNLEVDYFTPATKMNMPEAAAINKAIVEERGTKSANRKKFISLYDKLLK